MAEPGIFSYKEAFPTLDIQKTFEIPADVLVNIFGENDIKIQVPDVNNFLNPDQVGTQKFEDDKKLLLDLINNIRIQNNLTVQPVETYTKEQMRNESKSCLQHMYKIPYVKKIEFGEKN